MRHEFGKLYSENKPCPYCGGEISIQLPEDSPPGFSAQFYCDPCSKKEVEKCFPEGSETKYKRTKGKPRLKCSMYDRKNKKVQFYWHANNNKYYVGFCKEAEVEDRRNEFEGIFNEQIDDVFGVGYWDRMEA